MNNETIKINLLKESDFFKNNQAQELKQCGTSPSNRYNTNYYITNYFNVVLLVGVIIIAIILLRRNRNVISKFFKKQSRVFKKHSLLITISILFFVLLASIFINLNFRSHQLQRFERNLQHQFFSKNYTETQEYQNYLNCVKKY